MYPRHFSSVVDELSKSNSIISFFKGTYSYVHQKLLASHKFSIHFFQPAINYKSRRDIFQIYKFISLILKGHAVIFIE